MSGRQVFNILAEYTGLDGSDGFTTGSTYSLRTKTGYKGVKPVLWVYSDGGIYKEDNKASYGSLEEFLANWSLMLLE